MAALTVDFRKNSGPTPADDMAAQIITDCGNFTLDFKQHGFCASPLFLQTPDLDFQMKCKIYFHLKRGSWTTEQQSSYFSLAQARCFWWCFCFRSGLVALFLKMSERGDSWCTDSSFSSLLVKLSQVFESALLDSILKLAVIPVAFANFLPNFFLPVNFTFNMLWYSTPWTVTPLMTLCDLPSLWRVSMIVFWTIAKSAVFPIIVLSKNKRYPQFILYGWSFIETQIYIF